ncbi:phosphopantothenoylcysteine decarboxylase [Bacteroidia bacterium]|nr:phosphopantothenoylcysteine decarboxylase [Bacteroidia bacterium]
MLLIAPATANTIAKMANGIADNLLLTTYLSAKSPVMVVPAMDLDMCRHPATLKNLDTLRSYNNLIVEPEVGELASGLLGKGRMPEPETILTHVKSLFQKQEQMKGKRVLLTLGPTCEKIDDVRFIGNFSSGKMGFALLEEFAARGATVTVVSGPVNEHFYSSNKYSSNKSQNIQIINVMSAEEMYASAVSRAEENDIIVCCAAVADFTPSEVHTGKLKRGEEPLVLKLQPTKDIAAEIGKRKKTGQLLVGFALESYREKENALAKMKKKNLDLIVLNSLQDEGAGFGGDTNKVTIIDAQGKCEEYPLMTKREVARNIIDKALLVKLSD